jgi:hypothetical protein
VAIALSADRALGFVFVAVEVVCSLTSVKRKLQAKQEEYTALLERKQQLTAQS